MNYIEAPDLWDGNGTGIFLGGGITDCPDWQSNLTKRFAAEFINEPVTILNPRRANFPIDDPQASHRQIKWEYEHLELATAIIFWFSPPTLNPIVLFEFGKYMNRGRPLFVGCDPEYARISDVTIQCEFERPDIRVAFSLEELSTQVINWHYNWARQIKESCSKGLNADEGQAQYFEDILKTLGVDLDQFYSDQAKKGLRR
tara:strand:- start:41647 stop:42249 length:603 start_codon:yes stop_codon:yes gene_type:complete